MHRTTDRAPEMAQSQGVHAPMLMSTGVVDRIIAEHPDASEEPLDFVARVGATLEYELIELMREPSDRRLARRMERYRTLGI